MPGSAVSVEPQGPATLRSSRVRHRVVAFALTLGMLSYIQRVAISQAALPISADLHLDKQQMGQILGAFGLAYALLEIPMGIYGDRAGARRVLTQIVLGWSAFTAMTGLAWSFISLWVIRFLFGAGEAGCFPNLNRMLSQWLPRRERGRVQALMWASTRWGAAVTPPLALLAISALGWRWSFVAFALLGVVWTVFFLRGFRDDPASHPDVNEAERALLADTVPKVAPGNEAGLRTLAKPQVLLLSAQYFCWSYIWYFFVTWLPTYIVEGLGQSPAAAAGYAVMPLLCGGCGALVSGFLPQALPRRWIALGAFAALVVLLLALPHVHAVVPAILILAATSFAGDLTMPVSWNGAIAIGGRATATVSGAMNMCANLSGFIAPVIGGYILAHYEDGWLIMMRVMAFFAFCGAVIWIFLDPAGEAERPRAEDKPAQAAEQETFST